MEIRAKPLDGTSEALTLFHELATPTRAGLAKGNIHDRPSGRLRNAQQLPDRGNGILSVLAPRNDVKHLRGTGHRGEPPVNDLQLALSVTERILREGLPTTLRWHADSLPHPPHIAPRLRHLHRG